MLLTLSARILNGSVYYTVQPVLTWNLDDDWGGIDRWESMVEWCTHTFGATPSDGVWTVDMDWYINNAKFWFRSEEHRAMFILKWA